MAGGEVPGAGAADPGHREAIDTLLSIVGAENRYGEGRLRPERLDSVEQIMGALPQPSEQMPGRCRATPFQPPG